MTEMDTRLHREIISEFEKRIENNDEIPNNVVEELRESANFGLDSKDTINKAIKSAPTDETT